MATRYYIDTTAAPVSPPFSAGWEVTTGSTRNLLALLNEFVDNAAVNIITCSGVANDDHLFYQGVSNPIAAQTVGGGGATVRGVFITREEVVAVDGRAQVRLYIVSNDGSTVRGTLLDFDTGAIGDDEFSTSFGTKFYPRDGPIALSSVTAQDGDRIVLEIGFREHGTSTSTARMGPGGTGVTTDYAYTEGLTGARGWLEFSQDIAILKSASDTATGVDFLDTFDRQYDEAGTGADLVSQLEREYEDTGTGADDGGLTLGVSSGDTAVGIDTSFIAVEPKIGHFHIGKFQTGEAKYTIENEIIEYEQIDEGSSRINVVVVDGNDDSWTEYDRDDLVQRDIPINKYLDLPELKTPGEVRQRAVEEIQLAQRRNSPGGEVVWMPWFTKGDNIYWVDEDHNRYETRIEGISIEFSQSIQPYQRASIDTGILVFCPPDEEEGEFLARDLFNRDTTDGLGTALIGGSWNIFTS